MIETAKQRKVRFGYVGIDGGYGKDPAFLRGIDSLGCTFVADVHCRQTIYREDPMPHIPVWNGCNRQPKLRQSGVLDCAAERLLLVKHLNFGVQSPK